MTIRYSKSTGSRLDWPCFQQNSGVHLCLSTSHNATMAGERAPPPQRVQNPRAAHPIPGENDATGAAIEPVRAMVRSVGRVGLEPTTGGL